MSDTTEIEKKSLEAHVELCAERYRFLENKLETVKEEVESTNAVVREVHDMIHDMAGKRNDQVIAWGLSIMGILLATVGYLLATYVIK